MMQLHCLLLLFIPNVTLSQKDKGSTDPDTIGSSEKLREGNNNDNPTQTNGTNVQSQFKGNPDLTTIRTTSTSSDRENDGKISLFAY